jgi:hypothetical protein
MPRFLSMIRIDESAIGDRRPAGVLVDTGGLKPTSDGTRVHWSRGAATVTDGPFTESKEVVGGYCILQTRDEAEAIEWTKRFLRLHGNEYELTCELRELEAC